MRLGWSRSRTCIHHLEWSVRSSQRHRWKKGRTVDLGIHPVIHLVDFLSEVVGVEIPAALLFVLDQVIELGVEHPYDLRTFVVHDRLGLLVPQDGHSEATGII